MNFRILTAMVFGIIIGMGCVAPDGLQPPKDELIGEIGTPEVPDEELITTSGEGAVQKVMIKAFPAGSRWYFPMETYDDEFIDAGLHSDDFIKVDKSQITFLEDDEAVWLTLMTKDGEGVLFNAIYSQEISKCNATTVNIIGKEYEISELKEGSAFANDDKWKVSLVRDDSCLRRVIIYMDGYMYEIGGDEQIPIFRNDNTVLFRFNDLDDEPSAEVIVTKSTEQKKS